MLRGVVILLKDHWRVLLHSMVTGSMFFGAPEFTSTERRLVFVRYPGDLPSRRFCPGLGCCLGVVELRSKSVMIRLSVVAQPFQIYFGQCVECGIEAL